MMLLYMRLVVLNVCSVFGVIVLCALLDVVLYCGDRIDVVM